MPTFYTSHDIAVRFGYSPKHASRVARHLAQANNISKTGRDWMIPAAIVESWTPAPKGWPKKGQDTNGR